MTEAACSEVMGAIVLIIIFISVLAYCCALTSRITRLEKRVWDAEEKQQIADGVITYMQRTRR